MVQIFHEYVTLSVKKSGLLIQILPAFVHAQLLLDFIRRSVNIATAIWMYFVFNYCQYMTFGYCSQHSQGSFSAQIHKLKKANK